MSPSLLRLIFYLPAPPLHSFHLLSESFLLFFPIMFLSLTLCRLSPAGVPHFVQEPQDVATFPNVPFNLTCAAVGPPEPVEVLWWLGGVQEGEPRTSPSVLHVQGQKIFCFQV